MRLVGTSERVVVGLLIAYISFTSGFPAVRQALRTGVGKALALAGIVAMWMYGSHVVALLLVVAFVHCSSMREFMDNPPPGSTPPENTYCPENTFFDMGQCKNSTTGQSVPTVTCLPDQTWNGKECVGQATAPPTTTPPATTVQPFTNLTPAMVGGVQPDLQKTYENFAPV